MNNIRLFFFNFLQQQTYTNDIIIVKCVENMKQAQNRRINYMNLNEHMKVFAIVRFLVGPIDGRIAGLIPEQIT